MISETELTVRYAETDRMGIVHHSRYFPWFEVARTDWIKASGITYSQMEQMGIWLPLCESGARYKKGLQYEDEAVVRAKMTSITVARCRFAYEVYKKPEMELVVTGFTEHGFTDPSLKPLNLKKKFPEIWEKLCLLAEDDT